MNVKDTLAQALQARVDEVALYQINIDNYRLAIAHIGTLGASDQVELDGFKTELEGRLAAEIHQQKRAKVMLAVLQTQVEAL